VAERESADEGDLLDSKFFTPEIRADINYVSDFNHPTDHSIGGSSELFRSSEVQLEQFGVGGDFQLRERAREVHDTVWDVFGDNAEE